MLDRLTLDEAHTVLHRLLEQHPDLRPEAEQTAREIVVDVSAEDVAQDVFDRITGVDLDALNERAGAHSWGYVEPGEAAAELLEEAIGDFVEDMKRKAELGLVPAATAVCTGIIEGLYRARNERSDGALGWDPDFPVNEADFVMGELLRACRPAARRAARTHLLETLIPRVPEWRDMLQRIADESEKSA